MNKRSKIHNNTQHSLTHFMVILYNVSEDWLVKPFQNTRPSSTYKAKKNYESEKSQTQ